MQFVLFNVGNVYFDAKYMKRISLIGVVLFLAFVAFVGCHKEPIDFGNVGMLNIGLTRGYKTANKTAIELFDARVTVYYSEEDTVAYNCHFADLDGDGRYANDLSEDDRVYVRSDVGFWVGVWAVIQGDTVVAMSDPTNLLYLSEDTPVLDVNLVLEAGFPRIVINSNYGIVDEAYRFYGEILEGVDSIEFYWFLMFSGQLNEDAKRILAKRVISPTEVQVLLPYAEYDFEGVVDDNDASKFEGQMEMSELAMGEYSVVALGMLFMNDSDSVQHIIHSPVVSMTISGGFEPGPVNTDSTFEWMRQGSVAAGLEYFGLYWQSNAKAIFAQIKPLEDARLYVLTSSDYAIEDISQLSTRLTSETEATVYDNVKADANGTYNDVIATVYSGKIYLINVTSSTISVDSVTRIVVNGTYKVWISEQEGNDYSSPTGYANGYGYVDLGLPSGTLWAYTNLGSSTPYDYGDYYSWGETTTKSSYTWNNYQYCNGGETALTKYCNDQSYGNQGYTDALTTLESSDDAATVNRGANWRMPTLEDFQELTSSCSHSPSTQNGVVGWIFRGPNGNSIFLPAAGSYDEDTFFDDHYGYYWSSSLYATEPNKAWPLYFYDTSYFMDENVICNRRTGLSVRPVCVQSKKKRK